LTYLFLLVTPGMLMLMLMLIFPVYRAQNTVKCIDAFLTGPYERRLKKADAQNAPEIKRRESEIAMYNIL
jgi:hypothetical protein